MAENKFYCRIIMECNPGNCKSFVLSEKNEIVQEHYLDYGTGNLAEYISLMYAIRESLTKGEPVDIITSSQTAYFWMLGKNAKNSLQENEKASLISSIFEELDYLNKKMTIDRYKVKRDGFVRVADGVKVYFKKQSEWLSFYKNKSLSLQ